MRLCLEYYVWLWTPSVRETVTSGGWGVGASKMLGWLQHMTWVCSAHRREGEERIYLLFSTSAGL